MAKLHFLRLSYNTHIFLALYLVLLYELGEAVGNVVEEHAALAQHQLLRDAVDLRLHLEIALTASNMYIKSCQKLCFKIIKRIFLAKYTGQI